MLAAAQGGAPGGPPPGQQASRCVAQTLSDDLKQPKHDFNMIST